MAPSLSEYVPIGQARQPAVAAGTLGSGVTRGPVPVQHQRPDGVPVPLPDPGSVVVSGVFPSKLWDSRTPSTTRLYCQVWQASVGIEVN